MKVWRIGALPDDYHYLSIRDESEKDRVYDLTFDGRELANEWNPFAVVIEKEGERGDLFGVLCTLVLNSKALSILQDFLKGAEILPLICDEETLSLLNVTRVIDCVDIEKSEVKRFSSGKIMKVLRYAFIAEKIKGQHIFKAQFHTKTHVFVSDEFRNHILESDLKGFRFEEVWDSEQAE